MKRPLFSVLLGLALFLAPLLSSQARTAEEVNNYLKQTTVPDFTVENIPATDALASLQKLANLNQYGIYFALEAKETLKKTPVTLSIKNGTAYDLITMICTLANVKFVIKKDQVLVFDPGSDVGLKE